MRLLTATLRSRCATAPKSITRPVPATATAPEGPARFAFVDALRGLAALGVAAYHIYRYGPLPGPAATVVPKFLDVALHHGWIGVQIFFVISGFVIAYVLHNARITPGYLRNFVVQRSLRLGPPYWFTMLLVIGLFALTDALFSVAAPLMDRYPSWHQVAAHLFYLQNVLGHQNLSVGFWTLCIEMQFYLLFALLLGLAQWLAARGGHHDGKARSWQLGIVFGPLALASLFQFSLDPESTDWVFHFFAYFFLGALAWWTLEKRTPQPLFWGFVAAILIRLSLHWTLDATIALLTGLTIYTVGRLNHLGDWLRLGWLQYLGRISYSLYLIHYPVSWIITSIGYELTGDAALPAAIWLLLSVLASVGVAHILHATIELPAIRLASRFKQRAGETPIRDREYQLQAA